MQTQISLDRDYLYIYETVENEKKNARMQM